MTSLTDLPDKVFLDMHRFNDFTLTRDLKSYQTDTPYDLGFAFSREQKQLIALFEEASQSS
jgi:hypothetical protein